MTEIYLHIVARMESLARKSLMIAITPRDNRSPQAALLPASLLETLGERDLFDLCATFALPAVKGNARMYTVGKSQSCMVSK